MKSDQDRAEKYYKVRCEVDNGQNTFTYVGDPVRSACPVEAIYLGVESARETLTQIGHEFTAVRVLEVTECSVVDIQEAYASRTYEGD